MTTNFVPTELTESQILEICQNPDADKLQDVLGGNRIVKCPDGATVVKFGPGVREEEAANLKLAARLLSPEVVRVPRFYSFFIKGTMGYLVMEHISGKHPVTKELAAAVAPRVMQVVDEMHRITGTVPGPLGGGISYAMLWESDLPRFGSTHDLESWINRRLDEAQPVDLKGCELVLCFLDLSPGNILVLPDDSLCFIDWESAGYYPASAEYALLKLFADRTHLNVALAPLARERMDGREDAILEAWSRSMRIHFKPTAISNLKILYCTPPRKKIKRKARAEGHARAPVTGPGPGHGSGPDPDPGPGPGPGPYPVPTPPTLPLPPNDYSEETPDRPRAHDAHGNVGP